MPETKEAKPGAAVDAQGRRVVDPSENVMALVEASNKRQDDLRAAGEKFTDAQMRHIEEMARLRSEHTSKLSEAEAKRIDAIRAVDVNAVAVASERAAAAATVLATQVAQSADALRTLVSTTAATYAEQQRQLSSQFAERLTQVERAQYEGKGKQLLADPQTADLIAEVKRLQSLSAVGTGKSEGGAAV